MISHEKKCNKRNISSVRVYIYEYTYENMYMWIYMYEYIYISFFSILFTDVAQASETITGTEQIVNCFVVLDKINAFNQTFIWSSLNPELKPQKRHLSWIPRKWVESRRKLEHCSVTPDMLWWDLNWNGDSKNKRGRRDQYGSIKWAGLAARLYLLML